MCWCQFSLLSQEDGGKQLRFNRHNPRVKTRVSFSPVISLYKTNPHHTSSPRQKMSFCASWKEEIRLDRNNQSFFLFGVDYMLHGLNFNSYYFYSDSIKLYAGHMNYRYSLVIHELDFPVQLKYSFKKETNSIWSGYVFAGYCYRWLVASHLKVLDNGNALENRAEKLKFKSPAFNPVNNSFLNFGLGYQKNTPMNHNAVFIEFQFRFALSPFYLSEEFAPSSLYINGHHLFLTVGYKF